MQHKQTRATEPPPTGDNATFVIQKHDVSHLHYDFRRAMEGVLKSWAVPRGPSRDPSDKRLAIEVEDHELEYADFEGVIPAPEYGAGTVLLWDRGRYRNLRMDKQPAFDMAARHRDGLIEFWMEGEKLRGGFALKRLSGAHEWLLIKMRDVQARPGRDATGLNAYSVASGRDLAAIARAHPEDN